MRRTQSDHFGSGDGSAVSHMNERITSLKDAALLKPYSHSPVWELTPTGVDGFRIVGPLWLMQRPHKNGMYHYHVCGEL